MLDRLDWAVGCTGRCFGVRVGIRADDSRLLADITGRVPAHWRECRSPLADVLISVRGGGRIGGSRVRRFFLVYCGHTLVERTLDRDVALDAVEDAVAYQIAVTSRRYVFLHAGCVGWRGRAILLPGPRYWGKTTLVEALVREGADYYSDEYAPIDGRGRLHALGTPLMRREGDARLRIGLPGPGRGAAAPIGLLVTTRFSRGSRWAPKPVPPGERLLATLPFAAQTATAPAIAMRTLARALESAASFSSERGEARDAAKRILDLADSTTGELEQRKAHA